MNSQKVCTLHIYIRDPTVMAWIQSLPPRHRSKAIEAALRRTLEREEEVEGLARRVAEEVGKWLRTQGLVISDSTDERTGTVGTSEPAEAIPAIPQNAVTSFLQRWDDD